MKPAIPEEIRQLNAALREKGTAFFRLQGNSACWQLSTASNTSESIVVFPTESMLERTLNVVPNVAWELIESTEGEVLLDLPDSSSKTTYNTYWIPPKDHPISLVIHGKPRTYFLHTVRQDEISVPLPTLNGKSPSVFPHIRLESNGTVTIIRK